GVTFFAQYTPPKNRDDEKGNSGKGVAKTDPLRFASGARKWEPVLDKDPITNNFQNWIFPGFFEVGTQNHASFWFENRNTAPVSIKLARASFTAGCNFKRGKLAAIPPDVTDQLILTSILSGFPQGLASALPLHVAGFSPNLAPERLDWQDFEYGEKTPVEYKLPPASSSGRLFSHQWGILDIQFEVATPGPKVLGVSYAVKVEGNDAIEGANLVIQLEGVDPFEVATKLISVGDLKDSSDPRTYDFYVFSSTRGPNSPGPANRGDLVPPAIEVAMPGGIGKPGPFLTVSPPVRIPEPELGKVFEEVDQSLKKKMRIESAYRYTVTVRAMVGQERADIGPFEREINLDNPSLKTRKSILVRGMVKGAAWLDNDRTDIDLLTYRDSEGIIERKIRIITEDRNAVLELLRTECSPKFLDLQLEKLTSAADRGYHELRVKIPKNSQTGSWSGSILLELKGPRHQRMVIPIRGAGKS
ncbi:MAG TPA: hypothetical protein VG097_19220, partial [Gemmata sp.]|nr:hypothetical protein [Gemmata sp.]